jgi:hypothetical protein
MEGALAQRLLHSSKAGAYTALHEGTALHQDDFRMSSASKCEAYEDAGLHISVFDDNLASGYI